MNVSYLIDSIVQHTTVLIAQVATSGGVRAPLSHVAERVFADLVKELESQGVARKVAADMFGLALRSYQQKRQRMAESVAEPGRTLWVAVYEHLREHEVASRADLLRRFRHEDETTLKSVLQDLVESGLVYKTGTRGASVFRVAPAEDVRRMAASPRSLEAALWFRIYRDGPLSRAELQGTARGTEDEIDRALAELAADGRVQVSLEGERAIYRSRECLLPMNDDEAWVPNVVNHFQMVTSAICAKLSNGQTRAQPDEELGGSSYSFHVWPGHPGEARVRALLKATRQQVGALWDEVAAYNRGQNLDAQPVTRVNFYFGQSVIGHTETPGERETT